MHEFTKLNSSNTFSQCSLCSFPVGSFSTALQQARYFIYNTEVDAWTYLQARRGFWLERFLVVFFFLEEGGRKFLPGVGSSGLVWVKVPVQLCSASDGCFAERVSGSPLRCALLVRRFGDACKLLNVWNKASDWSARMRKDCVFQK